MGDSEKQLSRLIEREARNLMERSLLVKDVQDINGGHCRVLAENVVEEFRGDAKVYKAWAGAGSRHYFIKYDDRWYDAARPTGVANPSDFPFFSGVTMSELEHVPPSESNFGMP